MMTSLKLDAYQMIEMWSWALRRVPRGGAVTQKAQSAVTLLTIPIPDSEEWHQRDKGNKIDDDA